MLYLHVIWSFVVCSTGGLILDFAVAKYHGIAVFSPVMNGVGGNLVAVQASRLSTGLHQLGKPGQVQEKSKFHGCIDTFFGSGMVTQWCKVVTLDNTNMFNYRIFSNKRWVVIQL